MSGMAQGSSSVVGMGTLVLRYGKCTLRVPSVGHIVNARRTLLAGRKLLQANGWHPRENEKAVPEGLYDADEQLVIAFDRVNDLPFMQVTAVPAMAEAMHASGELWHARLAHANVEKVCALQQSSLVPTLSNDRSAWGVQGLRPRKMKSTPCEPPSEHREKCAAGEMMHYGIAFLAALGRKGERCLVTALDDTSKVRDGVPSGHKGPSSGAD